MEINDDTIWHTLRFDDCVERLSAAETGLDEEDARERLEKFGPNKLPEKKKDSIFVVALRQFQDPLIYVLLIAGVVSLALGHWSDALFIFVVLAFNSTLGTIQEYKAQISAESLHDVIQKKATVLRAGKRREIDAEDLVPGDIVIVTAGNAVPADIRLRKCRELRVDESLLTGESEEVDKDSGADLEENTPIGDRVNLLHAGTTVTDGRGEGIVCKTAERTEVGQIAQSLTQESEDPPLVQRMRRLTRRITVFIAFAITLLAIAQLSTGATWGETFVLAVALAVSAIPAGLPVAVTVALSVASHRMAKQQVIVRKLPAVEGLGSCTEICSDKTGTLTENRLTAKRITLPGAGSFGLSGEGLETEGGLEAPDGDRNAGDSKERVESALLPGILANEGDLDSDDGEVRVRGDTVDVAFLVAGEKIGLRRERLLREDYPQLGEIPYASERKYSASFHRHAEGFRVFVKGATETVLEFCGSGDADEIRAQSEALAGEGYRVIALASGSVEDEQSAKEAGESSLRDLRFEALVGLIDPLRSEVPDAIHDCHGAGVGVRMVTGDHPKTALAIGRQLGLAGEGETAVTGADIIETLGESRGSENDANTESIEKIDRARIFARIEPKQKTRLVEHLQDKGEFVAVTGDGVNDAPALNAAHISVAMGKGGTDVARRTAQLILGDDNFASIVRGIKEGRIAYDNVRKVVWLLISKLVAEIILFALALALGLPLPLFAAQLLWLNLVTNGIQDVALAFEGGEPGALQRSPRKPDEQIFNPQMVKQVGIIGAWMGLVAFGVFYYLIEVVNMDTAEARNLLLLLMVLFENGHVFNCRSEERSIFRIPLSANRLLIATIFIAQGVHIASMYTPGLSDVLGTEPVSFQSWAILLVIAVSIIGVAEIYKALRKRAWASR
ncbi:MAG: cation-translocating P-type ATPase [Puniceicoccaceae bacterium]